MQIYLYIKIIETFVYKHLYTNINENIKITSDT